MDVMTLFHDPNVSKLVTVSQFYFRWDKKLPHLLITSFFLSPNFPLGRQKQPGGCGRGAFTVNKTGRCKIGVDRLSERASDTFS